MERRGFLNDVGNLFLLGCLLFFALFLRASYQLEEVSSYLLPRGLAILGMVVASMRLGLGFWKPHEETGGEGREREGIHVLASFVFAATYFYLTPLLGFVLSTSLAIVAFGYLMRFSSKKLVVGLAVVIPVVLHLTFVELLKAPLPAGIAGF